ncbi:MAG: molybdopterin-dependent oxidoreductase [Methylocystis sp.]|nr:molybdopterin-dependent oxidoreductase [Methylocystis sp.]
MISRRPLLGTAVFLPIPAFAKTHAPWLSPSLPEDARENATLDALPGKKPPIKLTYRPPNYQTPLDYFRYAITPNDAFFVRCHLRGDMDHSDAKTWKLEIGGEGAPAPFEIGLADLKDMPATEIVAVNQRSGNQRGLFQPHVAGVQWGYGAMGCARWRRVRLKDLLEKAGVKNESVEGSFAGADPPIVDKTPRFVKSPPREKALDENALVACAMNGAPLPHPHGFPARIIAPGWTATYWIKLLTKPEDSFWMRAAYRAPKEKAEVHASVKMEGVAWDGGSGIRTVEISLDDGRGWNAAEPGEDNGRLAFREFRLRLPRDANCASRHGLDYIKMNAPFLPPDKWDAEVTKMIKAMGAPISQSDAKIIADYLKQNYAGESAWK